MGRFFGEIHWKDSFLYIILKSTIQLCSSIKMTLLLEKGLSISNHGVIDMIISFIIQLFHWHALVSALGVWNNIGIYSRGRDVNEPLQARGSTRSARKFRCSKVARLEIGSKIFCSIFARLEKCSKNFGSRSTLFENFWLEMLASLKRANFWKKLQEIYCQYCTWNQFWQIQNLKNNSFANFREFWIFVLHEINFDSFWVNFI